MIGLTEGRPFIEIFLSAIKVILGWEFTGIGINKSLEGFTNSPDFDSSSQSVNLIISSFVFCNYFILWWLNLKI